MILHSSLQRPETSALQHRVAMRRNDDLFLDAVAAFYITRILIKVGR
jgi:hypothetical protein